MHTYEKQNLIMLVYAKRFFVLFGLARKFFDFEIYLFAVYVKSFPLYVGSKRINHLFGSSNIEKVILQCEHCTWSHNFMFNHLNYIPLRASNEIIIFRAVWNFVSNKDVPLSINEQWHSLYFFDLYEFESIHVASCQSPAYGA